jgi:hypothetical protein
VNSSNRTLVVVLAAGAAAVLLGCCCIGAGALILSRSTTRYSPTPLSAYQKKVVAEFGPPQTFLVTIGEDAEAQAKGENPPRRHRMETWQYQDLGSQFVFYDGQYRGRTSLPATKTALDYPKVRPEQFSYGMSPEQVAGLLMTDKAQKMQPLPRTQPSLECYAFASQVLVTFEAGKLVAVMTIPTRGAAGKPTRAKGAK